MCYLTSNNDLLRRIKCAAGLGTIAFIINSQVYGVELDNGNFIKLMCYNIQFI